MNGLLAVYFCILGLFCAPIDSYVGAQGGEITTNPEAFSQQVVDGYGTILAGHVGMSGSWLYYVFPGDQVRVWYSDGSHRDFVVTEQKWYEMLNDNKLMRNVDTGQTLTIPEEYALDAKYLSLQTCAESTDPIVLTKSGVAQFDPTWGRYILVAIPAPKYEGEK
jgi:hypothetical protein